MTGTLKNKRGKIAAIVILVILVGIGLPVLNRIPGIGDPVKRNNRKFSENVKEWTAKAGEGDTVLLSELTPFTWNGVYTFDPYTGKEEMEKVLGCSYKGLEETVSEGMVQLIFVDYVSDLGKNQVVCSICGYGSNLGYGVDLGTRFDRKSNYVRINSVADRMTLRKGGSYPVLVFEGEAFEGVITELYEGMALVAVEEGWPIRSSGDQVFIGLDEELGKTAAVGDRVRVNYDGMVQESFPLQLGGQISVLILEE